MFRRKRSPNSLNPFWQRVLFARSFQCDSIHTTQQTTTKLAELVCYSNKRSDLRRITSFNRRENTDYDMTMLVKHDLGKRAYYTSTIVSGTITNQADGTSLVAGVARFGSTYLAIVLAISLFSLVMMIGTLAVPFIAFWWAILLLFMLSHIPQLFRDRNQVIRDIQMKCQQPLTQEERDAIAEEWQPISRYSEGNFYNTQAR